MPGGIDYELAYRCWRNNAAMACAYVARRMYALAEKTNIDAFDRLNSADRRDWLDKAARRMRETARAICAARGIAVPDVLREG